MLFGIFKALFSGFDHEVGNVFGESQRIRDRAAFSQESLVIQEM
jgi:hypothetical protein